MDKDLAIKLERATFLLESSASPFDEACAIIRSLANQEPQPLIDKIKAMPEDEVIERLRGQLQNCVNHLDRIKNRYPADREKLNSTIESANKVLYETLRR